VLVPGDPEAAQQAERERQGIPLPPSLLRQIREITARAGVADGLDLAHAGGPA
jgi:LDH2 family malate/lactate/ureidoglycolate dehydrogenase